MLKDTANRRQEGGSLPQAGDWREGGKSRSRIWVLGIGRVVIGRHAHLQRLILADNNNSDD